MAKILIVGGGLVGAYAACASALAGHTVKVFEKREDPRTAGDAAKRTINISLSVRGIDALDAIGVSAEVIKASVRMTGRQVHLSDGSEYYLPYSSNSDHAIYTITRRALHKILLDRCDRLPSIQILFGNECIGADIDLANLLVQSDSEASVNRAHGHIILIADGTNSAMRRDFCRTANSICTQSNHHFGYKSFNLSALDTAELACRPDRVHFWPGETSMIMGLANPLGDQNCALVMRLEGANSFSTISTKSALNRFIRNYYPGFGSFAKTIEQQYFRNPTNNFYFIENSQWQYNGKAFLLGDACYSFLPWYAQGINSSFSLVKELVPALSGKRRALKFRDLENYWRPEIAAIRRLSACNLIQLTRELMDPKYRLLRLTELKLESKYKERFCSLYSQIAFGVRPYSQVEISGLHQMAVLRGHVANAKCLNEIDFDLLIADLERTT